MYLNNLGNKKVSKNELKKYIDEYSLYLKKEMYAKYQSYDFLDQALEFVKNTVLNESSNNNNNLKTTLTKFKNYIQELLGQTALEYKHTKFLSKKEVNLFDSKNRLSAYDICSKTNKIIKNGNLQAKFFAQILENTFKSLNLDDRAKEVLTQRIIDSITKKTDKNYNSNCVYTYAFKLKMSNMSNLDSNNDGSWLQEFSKIVQEEASKIKVYTNEQINNAKTLDFNTLYGYTNNSSENKFNLLKYINVEELIEIQEDMYLSDDPGVRRFVQLLDKAYEELGRYGDKSVIYKWIIKFLNNESGNKTNTFSLSKDTINKLNSNNIFDKMEKIIDSNALKNAIILDSDGKIGSFKQGREQDCWLLSGLKALSSTSKGEKLIQNAISWNNDYTKVTISFTGTGDKITLTSDEILEFAKENNNATGDIDVVIIELAFKKLLGGSISGLNGIDFKTADSFFDYFVNGAQLTATGTKYDDFLSLLGGISGLTEGKVDLDDNTIDKVLKDITTKMKNNEYDSYAATFALLTSGDAVYSWTTVDGEYVECPLDYTGHVFAITEVTDSTVTFVNPWDSEKEYTVTWKEFKKIGIAQMAVTYF